MIGSFLVNFVEFIFAMDKFDNHSNKSYTSFHLKKDKSKLNYGLVHMEQSIQNGPSKICERNHDLSSFFSPYCRDAKP